MGAIVPAPVYRDGLYRVETSQFVAGFVIEGGRVTVCAPILRRRIDHWKKVAEYIPSDHPVLVVMCHDCEVMWELDYEPPKCFDERHRFSLNGMPEG